MTATHATQKKKAEALSEEGRYSPQYGGAGNRQEIDGVVHYADGSVFWVNEEDGNEEVMAVPSYEAHNLSAQ
ncbi:hypothetical protein BCR33DRAFT_712075 [Rhizoclosmatium globosum]|uniref:Uncharacterized protein n=1 Tax=Rhizoclosmatium globosum TaxID=329046 RepID=A0A1Y2CZU6_9FUNG|nr:hypothetical protein BCR33DRAFT_712075 [Rhizoclosmatium globosum]|eukprot:ORY51875.1 hypothetical protein BCR33DRAFT_712075 [Rhizoclosmatium globosum]